MGFEFGPCKKTRLSEQAGCDVAAIIMKYRYWQTFSIFSAE